MYTNFISINVLLLMIDTMHTQQKTNC